MLVTINIPDEEVYVVGDVIETKSPVEFQGQKTHVVDVYIKDADIILPSLPEGWYIEDYEKEALEQLILERNREY